MKKILLLLCLSPLLALTFNSKPVDQTWELGKPEILDHLDALSGKWDVITPDALKVPVLTQQVKYADYPKCVIKDKDFYDFTVSTHLYINGENKDVQAAGLVLRYRNLYSYYMLFVNAKDKRITLTRSAMGGMKALKRVNHNFSPDKWYDLKATCSMNHIKAFVDGEELIAVDDSTSTGGKVGLVAAGTTKVYFDRLSVQSETIEPVRQQP